MKEQKKIQTMGQQFGRRSWAEPYKIKMIEPIRLCTPEERETALRNAGYNTFQIPSELVYIDLLTDSGTSAMSDRQWAGLMLGDEAYAGSRNYYRLCETVSKFYGYKHIIPVHQGRGAENLLCRTLVKNGQYIVGNMWFLTTRMHIELAGAQFHDVVIDEAYDPNCLHPFKGNVNLDKLEAFIKQEGAAKIAFFDLCGTVNMSGGQPFSMANARALSALCKKHGVLLLLDATRIVENCFFIQEREPGYENKSIAEIMRELCSYTDGAWASSKKDHLVTMGGWIAMNDDAIYEQLQNLVVVYEGLYSYGGLSGRDLEAIAIGIEECVQEGHVHARIGQVRYLGELLDNWGIPIVKPIGGHAIGIDARAFYAHIPQDRFPAQTLTAMLYLESGVRSMENGIVSAGRDPETGDHRYPTLELVRLTIPRRVYTQSHMDVVAESLKELHDKRSEVKGLRMTHEPKFLRFFQARFVPIE